MKVTTVLTESQRGILAIALELARDRFADNTRKLLGCQDLELARKLVETFEEQAKEAEVLLTLVTLAENITITEEI
jgi:hypothetical protein